MKFSGRIGVFETLSELTPYDITNFKKIRIGPEEDGGYVLLNRLRKDQAVYSYGIGWDARFDLEMAGRGHKIFQFDHTIEKSPIDNENCTYFREGIAGRRDSENSLYTLDDHMSRLGHKDKNNLILKMDVEGAEWDFFEHVDPSTLSRFEQMVFEFHSMNQVSDPAFCEKIYSCLEKINRQFTLFHVHANNFGVMTNVNGFQMCDVIEVSYVRTDLVNRVSSNTFYPTSHDNANDQESADYLLWFFPFLPVGENIQRSFASEQMRSVVERTEMQLALAHKQKELSAAQQPQATAEQLAT